MMHEPEDKFDGQEESEYQFSDDHSSYEIEPEVAKPESALSKNALIAKFMQYRRPIIGGVVVLILLFLIYKILSPAAPTDNEIKPKTTSTTPQRNAQLPRASNVATPDITANSPMSNRQNPSANMTPMPTMNAEPTPPAAQPAVIVVPAAASTASAEKIAMLQEENAKLMQQIKSDASARMATYEAQTTTLQGKVQELNLRLTSLETTLARLGRLVQEMKTHNRPIEGTMPPVPSDAQVMQASPVNKYLAPHMAYSVQAIIPGRAWLKSDAGDTVTVAEGDVLKDYGRIMKIDPYDGVVQIDTGTKILTLSYGVTGN